MVRRGEEKVAGAVAAGSSAADGEDGMSHGTERRGGKQEGPLGLDVEVVGKQIVDETMGGPDNNIGAEGFIEP